MKSFRQTAKWLAACVAIVASFEGLATKAYPDRLAHGLPTVCYGETEGVKLTDVYTPAECAAMLANKLPRYNAEISRCITVAISDKERAAYVSFAYNVGSGAFCGSTARRLLNAGRHADACRALMMWNRASGRVIAGLSRRRAAERDLCLQGVAGK
jgi:lysozyme